jgi:hypothetical protein
LTTSTQLVWTYVFELAFLREAVDPWSLAGTGLIVGYMLVVAGIKIGYTNGHTDSAESETTGLLLEEATQNKKLEIRD